MPPGCNNGSFVGDTQREDAGDLLVTFNYGARFYELSVVKSKNSTRSRREPGGRRRGPIKISSGEVWPNSTSPVVVSQRGPFFFLARPRPRRVIHIFVFLSVHSSPFSSELSDAIKRPKRNTLDDVTEGWANNAETLVPSFKESVRFIPERIKRINTDAPCATESF